MFTETPKSERKRVSFIGKTNTGKSSLINAITGQKVSIVSPLAGTTTDHTEKAMEILPAGPLLFTDTPGIDDQTILGEERLKRTEEIIKKTDFVFFVFQPPYNNFYISSEEQKYIDLLEALSIPYAFIFNKVDLEKPSKDLFIEKKDILFFSNKNKSIHAFFCSAITSEGLEKIKIFIGEKLSEDKEKSILDGLISESDELMLIIPVNKAYPKGRLKPLQVAIMREALEKHIKLTVIQPEELEATLKNLRVPPKLIITDSQVINEICSKVPPQTFLTSFSILFANYKNALTFSLEGLKYLDNISDGDAIAIIEACTHHQQEGDMAREKLPEMLAQKTGKKLKFKFLNGLMPTWEDLSDVRLVLHCGGCMLTSRDMSSRIEKFKSMGVPFINYGVFISNFYGINEKALEPFRSL